MRDAWPLRYEKKVKPAIYEFELLGKDPYPKWGWVDLDELAEIVGYPADQKGELLLKYERVGGLRKMRWADKRNKLILTAAHEQRVTSVPNVTSSGVMFVPAGWALAVIEEVTRQKRIEVEMASQM